VLLVDANVLLNVLNEDADDHAVADRWLFEALSGHEPIGLAWHALLAVIRVSTHPSLFRAPLTVGQAVGEVEAWLAAPPALLVDPTSRHPSMLEQCLEQTGVGGNLVNDAHLAALAREYDATVISFDRDFGRFEGVRWRLPG